MTVSKEKFQHFDLEKVHKRFRLMYKTLLNSKIPGTVETLSLCEDFASKLEAAGFPETQVAAYAWLALTGTYLGDQWSKRIQCEYREIKRNSDNILSLFHRIIETLPDTPRLANQIELIEVKSDTLILDVTHTSSYPYISGIQRVVRSTIEALEQRELPYILVQANITAHSFLLMTDLEKDQFLTFRPTDSGTKNNLKSYLWNWNKSKSLTFNIIRILFRLLMTMTLDPYVQRKSSKGLIKIFQKSIFPLKKLLRGMLLQGPSDHNNLKVPILFDNSVTLLELANEDFRLDQYLAAKRNFRFRFTLLGYDLIPILEPEFFSAEAVGAFANYLRLVKVADSISCISEHTKSSFINFIRSISHEPNLEIETHSLPTESKKVTLSAHINPEDLPIILSVSTIEPRKNQLGALRAARILWRKGLKFKMVFAGNRGWMNESFWAEYKEAKNLGLNVQVLTANSEETLANLYQKSLFTIFCSFAEGFGLPIVESHAFGKPCITSNLSSMIEIAEKGGCMTVDPYSDYEIANAMEILLTDRSRIEQLTAEIITLKKKTWSEYAKEIYDFSIGN